MINLTNREKQVLNLIAQEHTSPEIASELFISENTARSHRKNLLRKLAVKNIAGMVRRGFELEILSVEKSLVSNHRSVSVNSFLTAGSRLMVLLLFLLPAVSIFSQGTATEVQNLSSVSYDNCSGTATIKFPMNENYSICNQTNQLRRADIYSQLPDGTYDLLGSVVAGYKNACPGSPSVLAYCRTYFLCNGTPGSTLSVQNDPGVQRTGVLTVQDMSNGFFGNATKIRFIGIYDQECCNEAFGFNFDFTITGPTQAAIAVSPAVSSLSSNDCNRVTVNWNGISVPGGCGPSANWSVQVFRNTVYIGDTKNSSFLDPSTNLVPGQTYAYHTVSVWAPNTYRVNQNVASNPINITIPQPTGRITGKVSSQANFGVQGVTVTATLNNIGSLGCSPIPNVSTVRQDVTDVNGNYDIQNLFVGVNGNSTEANYTVVASLGSHDITPTSRTVLLTNSNPTEGAVDFTDNSSATVTGTIFDYAGCPLPGALVFSNSNGTVSPVTSAADGSYALQLPGIGTYSLRSTFLGEDITRQMTFSSLLTSNFNFSHTLKDTICGFIGAGCEEYIGQATIQARVGNCVMTTTTTNNSGYYEMIAPRRDVTMKVTGITLIPNSGLVQADVLAAISGDSTITIDGKSKYDAIYRRPIVLELEGLPPPSCSAIPVPILETGSQYFLNLYIWDKLNVCASDTGTITINNFISSTSSQSQMDTTFAFSNGVAQYFFRGGEPMLTGNHRKSLTITATVGNRTAMETIEVVVVGGKKRGASFITAPVDLPLMILRDPPGDQSYSFFSEQNTFSFAQSFEYNTEQQVNVWAKAKIGADVFGVLKYWGQLGLSLDVLAQQNSSTENVVTITNTNEFKTSSNQNIIGAVGDVYVGAAINFEYSLADVLEFDLQNCQLIKDTALFFNPQGFSTDYLYTEGHIKSNVLPDLKLNLQEAIAQNQTDSVVNRIRSAISVWEQAIDLNAELKEEALNSTIDSLKVQNYSFDAAVEDVTKSVTTSRTQSRTINFSTTIDVGIAAEAGFKIGGSGASGGVNVNIRTTMGESTTSSINTTNTVGYVYNDDDNGDFISFDVGIDPVFGTPVFGNVLGETSCPNEEPTARRDDMEFTVVGSPVKYVPSGQNTAFFDLQLGNIGQGQPGEARYFKIYASNVNIPSGITIRSGGSAFPIVTEPPVGYGNNVTIPVEIVLSPGSTNYTLEGHEFFVIPECEENILDWYSKSVYLSAYFEGPCSDLTMPTPTENWMVTSADNNMLNVVVDDYDLGNIDEILLEYGDADDASWTPSNLVIPGGSLSSSPNGTSANWDVSGLPDGAYKIRWRLKCNGTTFNYSQRRLGIIDRSAPIAYGKPKPTDDNYVLGDEISVKLDQLVNCNTLSSGDIVMKSFPTNTPIPFQYICTGDEIMITPSIDISTNIGTSYIIEIYNLEDENGNINPDSVAWNFVVNDMDSDGDGVPDSFDRCPGGNDYYDTDLGGIPDDCDCDPLSGPDGIEPDDDCDKIFNSFDLCPDLRDAALHFDGVNDYVEVPSIPALDSLNNANFSISAWIYPTDSSFNTIVSKGTGSGPATSFIFSIIDFNSSAWPVAQRGTLAL